MKDRKETLTWEYLEGLKEDVLLTKPISKPEKEHWAYIVINHPQYRVFKVPLFLLSAIKWWIPLDTKTHKKTYTVK